MSHFRPQPFELSILEKIKVADPGELDVICDVLLRCHITAHRDELLAAYAERKGIAKWEGKDLELFLHVRGEVLWSDPDEGKGWE